MAARLTFHGGAGEVTGSCYLVDTGEIRFLIDCGMFQGGRDAERKNRDTFEFDPREIAFVLLSHAHIDHSGLIPRLAAQGFRGPVFATRATVDLCQVMLLDSAYIQEREVQQSDLDRRRAHRKLRYERAPLYTVAQAQASLKLMRGVNYEEVFEPHPGIRCRLRDAGHILGSAIVEVVLPGKPGERIVFSGDLGQPGHPIVRDAVRVTQADTLLIESTYGNRCHKSMEATLDELTLALRRTLSEKGGNVVIPAFAVGRTQDLLFLLARLWQQGRVPPLDVFVDSPMATAATAVTMRHAALFDEETKTMLGSLREADGHRGFRVRFIQEVEESMALNDRRGGAVIISASGMCDAGRIKHHLRHNLARPECSIVIAGFQAAGSLGRRLVDRAPTVRIFGEQIPVRAEVYTIGGLSAHADQRALIDWLGAFERPPRRVFIVHGEPSAAESLRMEVNSRLGWKPVVAVRGQQVALSG